MEYFGTIGPACDREDILRQMFVAGMTGIRMNMSHGSLAEHQDWVELLHRAAAEAGRPLKLLIDLQGAGASHRQTARAGGTHRWQ